MVKILPHGERTKAMLVSTGAEAVENAIKIARQATKRQAILCYTGAYHGRTMMAMTLTSKISYKYNCGPFAPEIYRLPFPNLYRYKGDRDEATFVKDELKRLLGKRMVRAFLRRHTDVNLSALDKYHTEIDDHEQSDSGRTV